MTRRLIASTLGLILLLGAGCKKKEEPEETETAATAAVQTPPPAASIEPELEPEQPAEPIPPAQSANVAAVPAPSSSAEEPDTTKKPVGTPSGYSVLQRCCSALEAAAQKGGLTKNRYSAATVVCKGLANQVKTGKANLAAARTTLRAQLQGVPTPGGC